MSGDYNSVVQDYSAQIQGLKQELIAPTSYETLIQEGERLLEVDNKLDQPLKEAYTQRPNPEEAERILAKALIDLELGVEFLQLSEAQAEKRPVAEEGAVRSSKGFGNIDRAVNILSGIPTPEEKDAVRGNRDWQDLPSAQAGLRTEARSFLTHVNDKSKNLAKDSLTEFLKLATPSVWELMSVCGKATSDLLNLEGFVDGLKRIGKVLLEKFFGLLETLLGEELMKKLTQVFKDWFANPQEKAANFAADQVIKLYKTEDVRAIVNKLTEVTLDIQKFQGTAERLDKLKKHYDNQLATCRTLLNFAKYAGGFFKDVPTVKSALAAGYGLVTAYIIILGADSVDSPEIKLIDFIEGIQRIFEQELK